MHANATGRLLEAWEQGQRQHPLHRALTLLRIGESAQTVDQLADLTIGERDRRLLALRERMFGPRFEAVAECQECQETVEFEFLVGQLDLGGEPERTADVVWQDRSIEVRLPTTTDLVKIALEPEERRIGELLQYCASPNPPDEAADVIQSRMEDMDPAARIALHLTCPACRHDWTTVFDIAAFLWTEISDQAVRLLRDIHVLARAYGWRERDILEMNPRRRQAYLDLVMGN